MIRIVKMNGMNKRIVAVDPHQVLFLEEHELNGELVTNVHFNNGKWATSTHPLNEIAALIMPSKEIENEAEIAREQSQLASWRRMAKLRKETQMEIAAELLKIGPKLKSKGYHKEEFPDGSGRLTIDYEPDESIKESL